MLYVPKISLKTRMTVLVAILPPASFPFHPPEPPVTHSHFLLLYSNPSVFHGRRWSCLLLSHILLSLLWNTRQNRYKNAIPDNTHRMQMVRYGALIYRPPTYNALRRKEQKGMYSLPISITSYALNGRGR